MDYSYGGGFRQRCYQCDFCGEKQNKLLEPNARMTSCSHCGSLIHLTEQPEATIPSSYWTPITRKSFKVSSTSRRSDISNQNFFNKKGKVSDTMFSLAFPNDGFNKHSPNAVRLNIGQDDEEEEDYISSFDRLIGRLIRNEASNMTLPPIDSYYSRAENVINSSLAGQRVKASKNKPPSEPKINKFKMSTKHYKKGANGKLENVTCCICLCDLKINEECSGLKCKHLFHYKCISKWIENKLICPVCRADIEKR